MKYIIIGRPGSGRHRMAGKLESRLRKEAGKSPAAECDILGKELVLKDDEFGDCKMPATTFENQDVFVLAPKQARSLASHAWKESWHIIFITSPSRKSEKARPDSYDVIEDMLDHGETPVFNDHFGTVLIRYAYTEDEKEEDRFINVLVAKRREWDNLYCITWECAKRGVLEASKDGSIEVNVRDPDTGQANTLSLTKSLYVDYMLSDPREYLDTVQAFLSMPMKE